MRWATAKIGGKSACCCIDGRLKPLLPDPYRIPEPPWNKSSDVGDFRPRVVDSPRLFRA